MSSTVVVRRDTSEATVPATVIISDGADSASFTVTAVDDALAGVADGTQTVTFTASADGLAAGTADVQVTDDDTLLVLNGDGVGGFVSGAVIDVGMSPWAIDPSDLDNDKDADDDIACANRDSANASVVLNLGGGSFSSDVEYATGTSPVGPLEVKERHILSAQSIEGHNPIVPAGRPAH